VSGVAAITLSFVRVNGRLSPRQPDYLRNGRRNQVSAESRVERGGPRLQNRVGDLRGDRPRQRQTGRVARFGLMDQPPGDELGQVRPQRVLIQAASTDIWLDLGMLATATVAGIAASSLLLPRLAR
jgi:hypothetical protein